MVNVFDKIRTYFNVAAADRYQPPHYLKARPSASQKVGSNFFLMNRRLSANLDYTFAVLSAEGGAASAAPNHLSISKIVTPPGVEPGFSP
jgi:hypothetical protein